MSVSLMQDLAKLQHHQLSLTFQPNSHH